EEAGVRDLVRQIARVCRKVARTIVMKAYENLPAEPKAATNGEARELSKTVQVTAHGLLKVDEPQDGKEIEDAGEDRPKEPLPIPPGFHVTVTPASLETYLGVAKFFLSKNELTPKVGAVMGLAWTSTGGDVLPVETVLVDGSERLTLTGQLGDVMKESAQAALTFIRSRYRELKVPRDFTKNKEVHVHLPEGAIPKDGPSAGITLMMSIISAVNGKPIRGDLAMTGEITLRGNVLAIGGLQEKLLAAKRVGIKAVIIPEENRPSLAEIPDAVKEGLNIIPVSTVDQAVPIVFDLTTPATALKAAPPSARKEPARNVNRKKAKKPVPSKGAKRKKRK